MMKVRRWLIKFFFLLIFGMVGLSKAPTTVHADINNVTVTPLIENSNITSRFELIVKPNEIRKVTISFTNLGSQKIDLIVQPTNATTSPNGGFSFGRVIKAGENNLKYAFADMTSVRRISLKGQETKDVSFAIQIPPNHFDGIIMGGFFAYERGQDVNADNTGTVVPVYLTETNKAVGGVLILKNLTAKAVNKQPVLYANLSNNQPGIMKNVNVHMTIERKGLAEFFHLGLKPMSADQEYKNIAPNSAVPVAFNQKQTPIKAGTYVVNGNATSGKTTWKFSGKYHISRAQADKVNKRSENLIYDKTWIFLLVIGGIVFIIIIILIILRVQSKKTKN